MAVTFNALTNDNTPSIDVNYLQSISFPNISAGLNFNANVQGCALVNFSFFASLKLQLQHIDGCAELQMIVNQAMNAVNAEIAMIESQIAQLLPMVELLSIPKDPLSWIISYIEHVLTPMARPYAIYIDQLAQTIAQVAEVAAIVEAAAKVIEGGCSINIPLVFPGCIAALIAGGSGNPGIKFGGPVPGGGIYLNPPSIVTPPLLLSPINVTETSATIEFELLSLTAPRPPVP